MAFIHKKMAKMLGALTLSIGFTTAGNTSACGAGLVAGMTYANQQYLMEADLNMRSLSAGVTAAAAGISRRARRQQKPPAGKIRFYGGDPWPKAPFVE